VAGDAALGGFTAHRDQLIRPVDVPEFERQHLAPPESCIERDDHHRAQV